MLICPVCESTKINQYRHPTGKIWCGECDFSAPHKEIDNPFNVKEEYMGDVKMSAEEELTELKKLVSKTYWALKKEIDNNERKILNAEANNDPFPSYEKWCNYGYGLNWIISCNAPPLFIKDNMEDK